MMDPCVEKTAKGSQKHKQDEWVQKMLSGDSQRQLERIGHRVWLILMILLVLSATGLGSQLLGGSRLGTWLFGCPAHQTLASSGQCVKADPIRNSSIPDNCLDPSCTVP
jgi:hypothetical protein